MRAFPNRCIDILHNSDAAGDLVNISPFRRMSQDLNKDISCTVPSCYHVILAKDVPKVAENKSRTDSLNIIGS